MMSLSPSPLVQETLPAVSSSSMPIPFGPFETTATIAGEVRPWGAYHVLSDEPHYKLKRLEVEPNQRLSLQYHHHREEHWLVIQGEPTITVGERTWQARPGDYIHIPKQAPHRLANLTSQRIALIEVQLGDSFAEDDIVRLQDDYQR
jgi:mannose-6-phosphate isomerase